MGCSHSKPNLPRGGARAFASAAIELCHDRSALLAEAIARRYALADAHCAYAASLSATGTALHDLLRAVLDATPLPLPGPDEALGLPAPRNDGNDVDVPAPDPAVAVPTSIPAVPDTEEVDDNEEEDGHPPQMAASLTPQPPQIAMPYSSTYRPTPQAASAPYGSAGYTPQQIPVPYIFDYPAVPYTYSSYYHYHQDQGQSDTIPSSHSRHGGYPYQYYSQLSQQDGWPLGSASSSHQLPPPSPPMESSWGFLDPFESLEGYYQDHPTVTAAQSMDDVRDQDEDMPELEEDEDNSELEEEECISSTTISEDEEQHIEFKESSSDDTSCSNGSNMVCGNGVDEDNNAADEQLEDHSGIVETEPTIVVAPEKVYDKDIEVVQEIKLQFEHASKSAGDVCKMPEAILVATALASPPTRNRITVARMAGALQILFSCLPTANYSSNTSLSPTARPNQLRCKPRGNVLRGQAQHSDMNGWACIAGGAQRPNLSCAVASSWWSSVAVTMRVPQMPCNGAEAHKLEEVEVSIKNMLSKIDVAIHIVNTISTKINKLRDEELWPQTHEVIRGFMQMWDDMSKCHQIQCHAMSQAKNVDSTMAAAKFSKAHMDLVKQLTFQLMDMNTSFATWFSAQKSYAVTLNAWLKMGIKYELEVTEDGMVPFSPGHLGAPPIFTICNSWRRAWGGYPMLRSEWRKDVLAHSTDLDRDLRAMDRDDLQISKAMEARNKKLELILGQRGVSVSNAHAVHEDASQPSEDGMQLCMGKVFEAMESFTTACGDAYKDLNIRSEEEKASFAAATCVDADKDLHLCSGGQEASVAAAAACATNADVALKCDTATQHVSVQTGAGGECDAHT
ncbi:hypothetical protein BS78_K039500 [Paspalum vaginatum]|uniref:DUF632 domain-containing protein n=1 Tax=Paspalum vaginatum TaxID=158149 RepID=A0A9W8CF04_9POAL|nr:hypothetical protein BS78_K039500 [Paspalum vaginatum]